MQAPKYRRGCRRPCGGPGGGARGKGRSDVARGGRLPGSNFREPEAGLGGGGVIHPHMVRNGYETPHLGKNVLLRGF